jgi:hypothetical protein
VSGRLGVLCGGECSSDSAGIECQQIERGEVVATKIDTAGFTLRGLVAELADRGLKVDYRTV